MPTNDQEIIDEFTRVMANGPELVLQVMTIKWDGPHTPVTSWVEAARLPGATSVAQVAAARQALLSRRRFFNVCTNCHERKPAGWMCDAKLCQSCATLLHGVVY